MDKVMVDSYLVEVLNGRPMESYWQELIYPMGGWVVKGLPPGMCQGCKNQGDSLAQWGALGKSELFPGMRQDHKLACHTMGNVLLPEEWVCHMRCIALSVSPAKYIYCI